MKISWVALIACLTWFGPSAQAQECFEEQDADPSLTLGQVTRRYPNAILKIVFGKEISIPKAKKKGDFAKGQVAGNGFMVVGGQVGDQGPGCGVYFADTKTIPKKIPAGHTVKFNVADIRMMGTLGMDSEVTFRSAAVRAKDDAGLASFEEDFAEAVERNAKGLPPKKQKEAPLGPPGSIIGINCITNVFGGEKPVTVADVASRLGATSIRLIQPSTNSSGKCETAQTTKSLPEPTIRGSNSAPHGSQAGDAR